MQAFVGISSDEAAPHSGQVIVDVRTTSTEFPNDV
jgi:hypothetical protein